MRTEEEIRKQRDIIKSLIDIADKYSLEESRDSEVIGAANTIESIKQQREENTRELWIYTNGVIRGRLLSLNWTLGESDFMEADNS